MSTRLFLYLNVAIAAIASAGVVVGLTLDTRSTPHQPTVQKGKPRIPASLPGPAGPAIEAAFRNWPHGSIDALQRLGLVYPGGPTAADKANGALVAYYRGIALFWDGYISDAESSLEQAKKLGRNTLIASRADNFLHPGFFQDRTGTGYPIFMPSEKNALLEKGSRLQAEGHEQSAEAVYRQAAAANPKDDEAQVAVAVALFDEDNIVPSFSRLGPLTREFPKSQSVRYYLGLLLVWTRQPEKALQQFKKTVALGPKTSLGVTAQSLVTQIDSK